MNGPWSLPALAGVPLVGAAALWLARSPRTWGAIAVGISTLFALQSLAWVLSGGPGVAVALVVNGAIAAATLLAQPLRGLERKDAQLPLVWLGANALTMVSQDARWVLLGWVLPSAWAFVTFSRYSTREMHARRLVGWYHLAGSVPLLVAVALFVHGARRAGVPEPFTVGNWAASHLTRAEAGAAFLLVSAAVMVKLGIPPLHTWLPALSETLPSSALLSLTGVPLAVHVMVRFALAPLPRALPSEAVVVTALGLVGLVYGAVLAVSQPRLRRLVAFVVVAQSSALLVGLSSGARVSVMGALTNALAVALGGHGLLLAAAAVEARIGAVDLRALHGVARPAPRLAAAMWLLALGALGMPGSLTFVGEDLLLQGLMRPHPVVASVMVGSTALLAVAVFRAVFRTSMGPTAAWNRTAPDLLPRERALLALALAAALSGVFPRPLITALEADADALLRAEPGGPIVRPAGDHHGPAGS
jgi:NADH-quinone oxidoreductase subunit M